MAFVPAPNIVMVEVRAQQAGQKIENRFMVNVLTDPTGPILASVAQAVMLWAQGTYFLNVTNNVSLTEVVATDMSQQDGAQWTELPSAPTQGSAGNDPMPNEVAYCISLRSGSRGRSARGRWYAFGLDKELVNQNVVEGTYRTAITGALQSLISVIEGLGYLFVIVSYVANGAPRPGGPVYYPVLTAVTADDIVDSMRKRKPGVGT